MKTKVFDCVAMKNEIQEKLKKKHGRVSWKERNQSLRQLLKSNPHLSRLLESKKN